MLFIGSQDRYRDVLFRESYGRFNETVCSDFINLNFVQKLNPPGVLPSVCSRRGLSLVNFYLINFEEEICNSNSL